MSKIASTTSNNLLEKYSDQLKLAMPAYLEDKQVLRAFKTCISSTPHLKECEPHSTLKCVFEAAQLGLSPGLLQHVFLIPRRQNTGKFLCTLVIGYRGMLELIYRSGLVIEIAPREVYENDDFLWEEGQTPRCEHIPCQNADRGDLRGVYVRTRLKGVATPHPFLYMQKWEIDEIKAKSPSSRHKGSPWQTHYVEMAKKTVIRRLFKSLPLTPNLSKAIVVDELSETSTPTIQQDYISQDVPELDEGEGSEAPIPSAVENLTKCL